MELFEVQIAQKDDFLKIAETLTRIGITSRDNTLTQTCHILHKKGKYYICHYLELFQLDGYDRKLEKEDLERRNGIVKLLAEWKLLTTVNPIGEANLSRVKVVSYRDKSKYSLKSNYTVGKYKSK